MLDKSDDISQSEDGGAKCSCVTRVQCLLDDCECSDFCERYLPHYNYLIERLTKVVFFTYNPKPKTQAQNEFMTGYGDSDFKVFKKWVKENFELDDNIDGYIAVSELTAKAQIHYHILVRFKDRVTFKKRIVQRLYYEANVDAQYKPPRGGIHYLFKQQNEMRSYHVTDKDKHIIIKTSI